MDPTSVLVQVQKSDSQLKTLCTYLLGMNCTLYLDEVYSIYMYLQQQCFKNTPVKFSLTDCIDGWLDENILLSWVLCRITMQFCVIFSFFIAISFLYGIVKKTACRRNVKRLSHQQHCQKFSGMHF